VNFISVNGENPMHSLFDLTGKVALVTGCNTGLGAALAQALAAAGCDIVGLNRSEPVHTQAAVEASGRRFVNLPADFGKDPGPDQAGRLVNEAIARLGGLDILVNNAGIIRRAAAIEFMQPDWDEVLDVNLKAPFFLAQAAALHFLNRGKPGKIINIASLLSFQGGVRVSSYTAAKSGVLGLTRLLANEWAPHRINVNAIAPGYMETNNTEALRADPQRNRAILERIPAGRWGMPDDLAGAIVFLASRASDYVHGHALAVDGGWLAR
jgi:2-deoxy-D-gluconate 3-dehydrogenase